MHFYKMSVFKHFEGGSLSHKNDDKKIREDILMMRINKREMRIAFVKIEYHRE